MVRGRKPQPTALKLLKGTEARYINENEPQINPGRPDCPEWLPDAAKAHWAALVPELDRMGVLTVMDSAALANACLAWANTQEAQRIIAIEGFTVTDDRGTVRKHPVVQVLRDSMAMYRTFAVEFGLTPSSRSRLAVPGGGEEDPFDAYLKNKTRTV